MMQPVNPAGLKGRVVFALDTDKPVAYDSPDHLQPHGTKQDNSASEMFNWRWHLWRGTRRVSLLDLGCSGGGFVKSILDSGGEAVGLEGSDYSQRRRRAEWATIPGNLFTADIGEPFQVYAAGGPAQRAPAVFDLVTAWEVLEHIAEDRLPLVMDNIARHLARGGVFIASISPREEVIGGVRLHQTVMPQERWLSLFDKLGFQDTPSVTRLFRDAWVRGGENAEDSFHVALTRRGEEPSDSRRLERYANDPQHVEILYNRDHAWQRLRSAPHRRDALRQIAYGYAPRWARKAWRAVRG